MRLALRVACGVVLLFGAVASHAQLALGPQFGNLTPAQTGHKGAVTYAAESQQIEANKPQVLELRFVVAPNFHINSAKPKSDLLIPTRLNTLPALDVKQQPAEYPAGTTFSFSANPDEKLDVYSGIFIVRIPVVAKPGAHQIDGTLHYQACDNASCFPPKDLQVPIIFFAK